MKLLIAILLLSFFASCHIGEKAIAKYKASPDFPNDCDKEFPPKFTEGKTDTVFGVYTDCDSAMKAYTDFMEGILAAANGDIQVMQDSLEAMRNRGVFVPSKRIQCPPSTHRVDTVESIARLLAATRQHKKEVEAITKELIKNDLAREQLAKDLQAQKVKTKKTAKQRNWAFAAIAGVGIYVFRKPLLGLIGSPFAKGLSFLGELLRRKK